MAFDDSSSWPPSSSPRTTSALLLCNSSARRLNSPRSEIAADRQTVSVSEFERKVLDVVKVILCVSVGCSITILLVQGLGRDQFRVSVGPPLLSALGLLIAAIPVALP